MRALVRAIVRSPCVAAVVEKIMDKHACSTMMGRVGSPKVASCNGMGLTRKYLYPLHVPVQWSSSETNGNAASPADGMVLVKEIAEYVAEIVKNHPEIMDIAAYSFTTFITYYIFPRILMHLRYRSVKYSEYEKCIRMSLVNTERQLCRYYPMAAIGLVAFSEMTIIVAPSMKDYIPQLWEGASIACVLGFLHVLRESFVTEAKKKEGLIDRKWLSNFDKISSISLISLGFMGVAEVGGLSLQSLATISGAGVVLTAFAGKDIFGNILNGFSLQLTDRFSVGEQIKAGCVEGTVIEIGLTSTTLINHEHLPITVPNSYFLGQVVVNRSRATSLSSVIKIPVKIEDVEKLLALTQEVTLMLKTNTLLTLAKEGPYCHVSRVGKVYGELVVCFETQLTNEGLIAFEQKIMLETLKIMRSVGVEVGDPLPSGELEALLEAAQIIKSYGGGYTG